MASSCWVLSVIIILVMLLQDSFRLVILPELWVTCAAPFFSSVKGLSSLKEIIMGLLLSPLEKFADWCTNCTARMCNQ